MKIVLTGIQGAGKSTQGNLLERQFKLPYISAGHIFRQISKEKTKLGRYLKELTTAGILIPDNKTIEIVNSYLSRKEYQRGYILDGFPRTITQAEKFKNDVDKVIFIEIPDKESLWRLAYRNDHDRDDNTIHAIRKRIELFHKHTKPVVDFYEKEKKLVVIDGTQSIEEVNEEILKSLGKQLIKNQIISWHQKKKCLIAIVGLSGSGKTEAAEYFKQKELPVIAFGKIINDIVDEKGLPHKENIHRRLRNEFRKNYGNAAMAIVNKEKIHEAFKKNNIVVIDGLYSWEEYEYIKKEFPEVEVYILALYADKNIRYKRIAGRKHRSKLFGEERDINELIETNKAAPIAFADFFIKNNYSLQDLHDKLEQVYREVYFS